MITNTSKEADKNPILPLAMAMALGSSNAIYAQEARGQQELVCSEQLPTDGSEDPRWALIGVTFGPPTPGDEMFRPATLPAGWSKKKTDHSMWSQLLDDKGRVRASIFYKAAFYDRSAHMGLENRFAVRRKYAEPFDPRTRTIQYSACDGDTVLYLTNCIVEPTGNYIAYDRIQEQLEQECKVWLDANRPGWDDYMKSWEIE